ncbi:hypothetical protein J6590_091324, partial [Homalodisca vitripennis]
MRLFNKGYIGGASHAILRTNHIKASSLSNKLEPFSFTPCSSSNHVTPRYMCPLSRCKLQSLFESYFTPLQINNINGAVKRNITVWRRHYILATRIKECNILI